MSSLVSTMRRSGAPALLALCAVLGLQLAATGLAPAAAQSYSPAGAPTLSTASPAPGGTLRVAGSGFRSGSRVRAVIFSEPVVLGTAKVNAAGEVAIDVTIPASFAPGSEHRIELQGVDPDGEVRILSRRITLAGGDRGVLPFTGAASVPALVLAGLLLVGGGVLLATSRARRRGGAA
jgi:LPXTG-motif cell wall-anchored protein